MCTQNVLQNAAVVVSVMRLVVPAISMRLRAMSASVAADVLMGLIEVKAMTVRQTALRCWVIAGAEVAVGKVVEIVKLK